MKSLGLSFLLGLVSATGFQPLGLWPLTILAFTGLLLLIERAPSLRSALARGWWFGMGQFVLGLNWIATAFTYQAAMPAWLGWIAVVVLSFYLSVYTAAATGLAWRWARPHKAMLVLILAAAWIVTEWLRGTLFTGFAWNPVGVSLIDTWAKWPARLIGTYGLSGLVILWAGLLWWAARHRNRALGVAVALLPVLLADLRLTGAAAAPEQDRARPALRVVQPDIPQEERQNALQEDRNFIKLLRLTGLPDGAPRLILWPEAAVPYNLHADRVAQEMLASRIGPRDLLLTGGIEIAEPPPGVAAAEYNSLYLLGPGAMILGRYDKAHLVPYGEYLPMRPFLTALGLSRLVPGAGDILSGPGPGTLDLPGFGRMGAQICYEIIFSGEVVDRANRPDFLFNPSNDAWFGAWGPPQHFAQARLRALEEGLPIVRSTPTGITGVIDAQGRIVERLPQHEEGVIDTRLPRAAAATPFAQLGNLLPFAFALLLVAAAIAVRRKTR
ncbi:MAG TPA: apolipoprotein N-acyltransferase [Allosphingosinicella sp.]|nr:apolipoprotein N-acyltransferase [Allosphingosinicella sp.]